MGACLKYLKRSGKEDYALLDTAVGVQRIPYQGYFCGNPNTGRGRLADRLSPSQTYFTKTKDWKHQKSVQPCWTGMCGGPSQFELRIRLKGTVRDKKNLLITLGIKKNTFQSQYVLFFSKSCIILTEKRLFIRLQSVGIERRLHRKNFPKL